MISFNPPLPEWKTEAISRLGYGNLNKVKFQGCGSVLIVSGSGFRSIKSPNFKFDFKTSFKSKKKLLIFKSEPNP